ncbi:hypothetical protein LTR95_016912 [Oleoguttula sp. CCFEE 5521]
MTSTKDRQYEIILFGATGYTGKYTAEYFTKSSPTNCKWAIAGRSQSKLQDLAKELQALNPNRAPPAIETSSLEPESLEKIALKTKVLVTTVGPYHKYGTPVLAACAKTGTHYLDVTGEIPWVYDMVNQYHDAAKHTGAIIIPQCGVESAPSDLMCWALVNHNRETLHTGTGEIVYSMHDMKGSASGGTLSTILTLFDRYGLGELAKSSARWSISAVKPPKQDYSKSLTEKLTGLRTVDDLGGTLTDSLQSVDIPIVHRSWSLYDGGKLYGDKFHFTPYMRASGMLQGLAVHFAMGFGLLALLLPPVRWLLQKYVTQPGSGATKEYAALIICLKETAKDFVEWRAIATADSADPTAPKRASARWHFNGSLYHMTGILVAEAALAIARDETPAHGMGGGVLTPATLGGKYLDRMKVAGVTVEVATMP